jgi:hypothetical protein
MGSGVGHGLMGLDRFSGGASNNSESKGDENESVFHGRIPYLTLAQLAPVWAGGL